MYVCFVLLTLAVDPTSGASSRLAASSPSFAGSRRDSRRDSSTGSKLSRLSLPSSPSPILLTVNFDFDPDDWWITRQLTRWPSTNLISSRWAKGIESRDVWISYRKCICVSNYRALKVGMCWYRIGSLIVYQTIGLSIYRKHVFLINHFISIAFWHSHNFGRMENVKKTFDIMRTSQKRFCMSRI